jgi:putative serine protease PepD
MVATFDRPAALTTTTTIGASVARSTSAVTTSTATAGTPEAAAAVIGPSVVTVEVSGTSVVTSPFGQRSQQVSDTGSGIVVRVDGSTGYILTNNHVVSAALSGGTVHITLNDGRTVAATIVGHDTTSDLAVVKVTGITGLTAAVFADSDALKVGQAVLAIGAPLGLSNTVTQGIVSTLHRPVATGESGAGAQAVLDAVQTDAAINPGNSGGALVDLAGRVVGINSAIASTGSSSQSGNIGVGFAIPSNDAADVADQLIATGHATHAQIGISAQDAASSTDGAPGLGAAIGQVTAGGPAAKAGLQQGDLITRIGNRVVTDADSLIVAVRANAPGSTVTVTYERSGQSHTAAVTLGAAGSG